MRFPFFSPKTTPSEYFFGLFLKENKGIGYIIKGHEGKLRLLAKHEFAFSNGWGNITEDVDDLLFQLENETKCRVEKTIFFLFSHLIDEKTKEIKKPYLQKIKELTKNLEVKPIGYIECYEAVVSFLETKEGMPLTSILIELDDSNVDIFIYKGGHKIHNYVIARTNNIIDDLHSVFDNLGKNTLLPNRIILYNSSGLVDESTKIISHKWSTELFVQLPRVEILKEKDIFDGLLTIFEQQTYQEPASAKEVVHSTKHESMGFMIGKDINQFQDKATHKDLEVIINDPSLNDNFIKEGQPSIIDRFKTRVISVTANIPKLKFTGRAIFKKQYLWILLAIFFIFVSLYGFERFVHKATITVAFPSISITKQEQIYGRVDNLEDGYLPVQIATSSVEMKDIKATTGKRDIGEKARGEVTLYNFDDKDKIFPKGSIIQVDNLQFSLEDEVKVIASSLASDASAKLPGKSKVKVVAQEIGTESNLEKAKRFKVSDLSPSVYFAMNDNSFSGGTRKTVKTVSTKDIEDLKASLLQKAKDKQRDEIYKTKDKRVTLIDSLLDFKLSNIIFSKELGEEGDNITLQAKVVAKYYYFDTSLLTSLLKKTIESEVKQGYKLEDKNIKYVISTARQDKEDIVIPLNIKAKATKSVDADQLTARLSFQQADVVAAMLKSEYAAFSSKVDIKPSLPFIKNILPFFKQNIDLHIESL